MDEITEIKDKIDIVDLVGHYVALKKAGANFKGLCPFHHEKSPSFMVNPERQSFKCFGCNKGGDIFTFIQEIESVEFGDALKMLADRAGITLKPRVKPKPGEAPSEKSRYYAINGLATQLFHKLLVDHPVGKNARDYLARRGISQATIQAWQIGYAPRKKVLAELLAKRGFTPAEVQLAGKPDMFYDRIMFPIMDVMGNVVGFTGRILGSGEPKYLNTPETAIFRKSRLLFGLEKAKAAIKEQGRVILTEGQMDVISASQSGTPNVVATSGTALTQDHLRILARYGVDIIFAFDTDGAGINATKRGIEMAISDDLPAKVIPLPPPFKDIGEIVEQNPKLWLELAQQSIPAIEWQIESVFQPYVTNGVERKLAVEEKKKAARELVPVLRRIPDTIEQAHYIQRVAQRLGVTEQTLQQALARGTKGAPVPVVALPAKRQRPNLTTSETLLGLLERSQELQTQHQSLYNELKSWYTKPINDLVFAVEDQYRGLTTSELRTEIDLLIQRYQDGRRDQLKDDFAQRISQAEATGNRELVKKLLTEFQQLIRE